VFEIFAVLFWASLFLAEGIISIITNRLFRIITNQLYGIKWKARNFVMPVTESRLYRKFRQGTGDEKAEKKNTAKSNGRNHNK